jgi:hypothetical protein
MTIKLIKIRDKDKAKALCALYNNSKPQGLGFLHAVPGNLDEGEAASVLEKFHYVDYLKGRVIKTDFYHSRIDTRLYDRDNGDGAGERALREAGLLDQDDVAEKSQ